MSSDVLPMQSGVLKKHNVELIGAKLGAIQMAEDRLLFKEAMERIGLKCAESGACTTCAAGAPQRQRCPSAAACPLNHTPQSAPATITPARTLQPASGRPQRVRRVSAPPPPLM